MIVAPSVSCHASLLASASLMNGDLRKAQMDARFGAARYHSSFRMTSTKKHDADLVAVVPDFVLERVVEWVWTPLPTRWSGPPPDG